MSDELTTGDLVEKTRMGFEALGRRDFDTVVGTYAPDISFTSLRLGVSVAGRASVRRFAEEWIGAFQEIEFDLEKVLDLGGGVILAIVRQRARPIGTQAHVDQRDAWVTKWTHGSATRVTAYGDIDEARAAAERLAESPKAVALDE